MHIFFPPSSPLFKGRSKAHLGWIWHLPQREAKTQHCPGTWWVRWLGLDESAISTYIPILFSIDPPVLIKPSPEWNSSSLLAWNVRNTYHIINTELFEIMPLSRQTVLIASSFHIKGGLICCFPLDGSGYKTNTKWTLGYNWRRKKLYSTVKPYYLLTGILLSLLLLQLMPRNPRLVK